MILALAVATADASGPVAEASGKRPLLISNCVKPKFKPAKVIIACGDASLGARELTWSKWTHKLALGTGTGRVNDCDPDCVHGTMKTGADAAAPEPSADLLQRPAPLHEAPLHLDGRPSGGPGEELRPGGLQARQSLIRGDYGLRSRGFPRRIRSRNRRRWSM